MMNNLYELNQNYKELSEILDERLANGEEVEDYLIDTLDAIADAREVKFDNVGNWIDQNERDIEFYRNKIDQLQKAKKILENRNDSLKQYLIDGMAGAEIKELRTDNHIIKLQGCRQRIEIKGEDVKNLPEEYRYVETTEEWKTRTDTLYNDLKAGKSVENARLAGGKYVKIS